MPRRMQSQPRIPGIKRTAMPGSFHPDVEQAIRDLQRRYSVSRAWVITFYVEIGMFGHASAEHVEDFRRPTRPARRSRR